MSINKNNRGLLFFSGISLSLITWLASAKPEENRFSAYEYYKPDFFADSSEADTVQPTKYKPSRRPTYKAKDRYGDEFSNSRGKQSPLDIGRPKSVKTDVRIDESGEYYTVDEKLNGVDYRAPTTMTYEQYKRYQNKEAVKNFFRGKSKGADEKDAAKNDKSRALVPRIYVSSSLDRIFGGNYVDVKLNGQVLLDFGYRIQTTSNPAIPVNQRTIGGFFFSQQIAMNAQAKIGERLKITVNQDTKSQFDFDNNIKIEYSSLETDVIQKIEAGNVSMPINSSLIKGAQNLFGVKTTMKFGRLTAVAVVANQRGATNEIRVQGGAQTKDFQIRADNYEDNRHYFLGQFFRNNYERSLVTTPQISSGVYVTRVEVWVTNRNNTTDALRNMAAFMDLGEHSPYNTTDIQPSIYNTASNNANTLFSDLYSMAKDSTNGIRNADNTVMLLDGAPLVLENGNDYEIIRGARRLKDTEFKFHPQLGYISLNAALGRDDVLGVAYEYSYQGKTYQVGELTNDYQGLSSNKIIFTKLLRPSTIRTDVPMWNLQMKNIYPLGSTGVSRENFQLRVTYRNDQSQLLNPVLSNDPKSNLDGKPLLQVMGLDRLNMSNDPQPDGNFDFVDSPVSSAVQTSNPIYGAQPTTSATDPTSALGTPQNNINTTSQTNIITAITIDAQLGRIIFPVLEPFGKTLKEGFGNDSINNPQVVSKYVYDELYRKTKSDALQLSNKNKFFITGRLQSSASDEIPLQSFGTLSPGAVSVTAGSIKLVENQDYTVDYNLGKVKIINPAYLLPGQDIRVSVEKNDLFQVRTKTFYGTRLDYVLNKDIAFGGTFLSLNERPLISRVAIGDEPVNNAVFGLDGTYRSDSRLITTLVDKLPVIQTKEKSTIQINGEVAKLFTSAPSLVNKGNSGATFYIDDFENTSIPFRLDNNPALNWRLASTPPGFEGSGASINPLATGFKRAKLSWYIVDPLFYRNANPGNITAQDMSNNYVRAVQSRGLFPGRYNQQIQLNEPIFDLAYFPNERGPYNYNTNLDANGLLPNPENNWAGITRAVNNYDTDFDNANYQYMEFWLMDPFLPGETGVVHDGKFNKNNTTGGKMLLHLGSVSEDVMKDGKQEFEQGLPANGLKPGPTVDKTVWGYATNQQFITNAFTNDAGARANQDIGLDGLNNNDEQVFHNNYIDNLNVNPDVFNAIKNDPSGDDFKYFLGSDLDASGAKVLERYKNFNGQDGNSPDNTNTTGIVASSYTTPDNEDINQNNTLNDIEEFFQYEIDLKPGQLKVGENFIVNSVVETITDATTGQPTNGPTWYLFRVPLRENYTKVGNIENFKSIKFLRTVVTGWKEPVVLRMAQFQLVASQWRPFTGDLTNKGLNQVVEADDQVFTVSTVNAEENSQGSPTDPNVSPYVVPPGFQRDRDVNSTVTRYLNEHSLRLSVNDLVDGDARAVFKNTGGVNLINYDSVLAFVHAEANPIYTKDDQLTIFMRIGSDFTDNYYEIEKPLKLTRNSGSTSYDPNEIWREENWFKIGLEFLSSVKLERDRERPGDLYSIYQTKNPNDANTNYYVRGNPTYTNTQTIMIGIRNPKSNDRESKSVTVWVDELRVAGIRSMDGWAATGKVSIKLADLGNVTGTLKYTGAGFGGLEQKISQRLQESTLEYGANANLQLDKFIPGNSKIGIKLPVYASINKKTTTPLYDPMNPDVKLDESIKNKEVVQGKIDPQSRVANNYASLVQDNTVQRSISFTNIQKVKVKPGAKKHIYDIENISVTLGYSDTKRSNVNLQDYDSRNYKAGAGYNYAPRVPSLEPFKNVKLLNSPYFKLIKDVNISLFPSSISIRGDLDRTITHTQYANGIDITKGTWDTVGISSNYEKRFLFNRNYAVGWTITKSITFNYNASVNAIVDEPAGGFSGFPDIRPGFSRTDSVLKNLTSGGRIKTFTQQIGLNYKLPLDKFPATNWLNADVRYAAGYNWNAGPYPSVLDTSLGNTAQNNRDITLNGRADFTKFYNKIKFLSKINSTQSAAPGRVPPRSATAPKDTAKKAPELKGLKGTLRLLMMVRSANITYQRSEGTVLPGYQGNVKYFGMDLLESGSLDYSFLPFILGSQDDNIYKNKKFEDRYMSKNQFISNPITQNFTENISGRANIEPFDGFKIQLDARISNQLSYTELLKFNNETGTFESLSPQRKGSYSMTFISILSFFGDQGPNNSSYAFNQMQHDRLTIEDRLTHANPDKSGTRYDTNNQDVLIPAFLSSYSGKNASTSALSPFLQIPLPNWRIDYAGLPNLLPSIKRLFPSVNISHSYSSIYTVNSYSTSPQFYGGDTVKIGSFWNNSIYPTIADSAGNYQAINIINSVSIVDRFAPLLGVTVKTKNNMSIRAEYRTDRTVTFNLQNRQITEMRSGDITIGYGFTKSNMKLPIRYQGREIVLKNDITFRVDITRRESVTYQRKLDDFSTVITQGQVNFQIRPNISYMINQRLTTQAYFEYTLNDPKISTSFTQRIFAFGLQLRYSLS